MSDSPSSNSAAMPIPTPATLPAATISALLQQNPVFLILLLLVLGGQGMDIFTGQNSNVELRQQTYQLDQLADRVAEALEEVRDNEERIERQETRLDRLQESSANIGQRVRALERAVEPRLQLVPQ